LLVGDLAVGKTSLVTRYKDNTFFRAHCSTVGVEFDTKLIHAPIRGDDDDDSTVKLHIWDTAGHESFRSLTTSYYLNAAVVFVVFDLLNRETFDSLPEWISRTKKLVPPEALIIMVGNKVDDVLLRQVSLQEAEACAKSHDLRYFETSAKSGEGVEELFVTSADEIRTRIRGGSIDPTSTQGIKMLSTKVTYNL